MGNNNSAQQKRIDELERKNKHLETRLAMRNSNDIGDTQNNAATNGAGGVAETKIEAFLNTIKDLPNHRELLDSLKTILEEKKGIIKKIRDLANDLEKINGVQIVNGIGKGIETGACLLTIGSIIAAPFNKELSLRLHNIGKYYPIGSVISIGANQTDNYQQTKKFKTLEKEVSIHQRNVEELCSSTNIMILYKIFNSPGLQELKDLVNQPATDSKQLISLTVGLIQLFANNYEEEISRMYNNEVNPNIKGYIEGLLSELSLLEGRDLEKLSAKCSEIASNIIPISNAIGAILKFVQTQKLDFIRKAIPVSVTIATLFGKPSSINQETPTFLTLLNGVVAFEQVITQVKELLCIWKKTGQTPAVQKLREIADDLEKQITSSQQLAE